MEAWYGGPVRRSGMETNHGHPVWSLLWRPGMEAWYEGMIWRPSMEAQYGD